MAVNDRALLGLGVLLMAAQGSAPGSGLRDFNEKLRKLQSEEPMTAIMATVLVGAAAFYALERGRNPKVNSYYDALVYVSTNLSVGFSDIFAQTPLGKVLGSALMTWGPALATRAFDAPTAPTEPSLPAQEIVSRLDAILEELRAQRA